MILGLLACAPDLSQPTPIVWDRVACDHCGMLVSDPRFAAQLVTRSGERREYDDPACLFHDIADTHPSVANAWFHDGQDWVSWTAVEFTPAADAPMDGGVAARPAGGGGMSFGAASALVLGSAR
jgi:hypothetical protein